MVSEQAKLRKQKANLVDSISRLRMVNSDIESLEIQLQTAEDIASRLEREILEARRAIKLILAAHA